jgi:hypothetical protein
MHTITENTGPLHLDTYNFNQNKDGEVEEYYIAKDIGKSVPAFGKGCMSRIRCIVDKRGLLEKDILFATESKSRKTKKNPVPESTWTIETCEIKSPKAVLFIRTTAVHNHPIIVDTLKKEQDDAIAAANNVVVAQEPPKYPDMPPTIRLKEPFLDSNNNAIELKYTCGAHNEDEIRFCGHEVSVGFNIPSLTVLMTNS